MAIKCVCGEILMDECGNIEVDACESCMAAAREAMAKELLKSLINEIGAVETAQLLVRLGHEAALRAAIMKTPRPSRKQNICTKGPGAIYSNICACQSCTTYRERAAEAEDQMRRED